jgi:putative tryptophan/tyrosine transport system substrate-binding protein
MRRREFIALISSATFWPLAARAQHAGPPYRIGYLSGGSEAGWHAYEIGFREGMRDLGYAEGQDFMLHTRYADGNFDRLESLTKELLGLNPQVLLVATTPANLAAQRVTAGTRTPIVMVEVADRIGVGLIASLARPGGNITGVTNISAELAGKRLEILKELFPAARKVAVLINPDDNNASLQMRSADEAAKNLSIQLAPIQAIRSADDLTGAFEAIVHAGADAALRMVDPVEFSLRGQTIALADKHRIGIMFPFREAVAMGGLTAYGTDMKDQYRQAATFVDKILHGANPSDLPVAQPTKFHLAINLTRAKTLGLTVPASLLARADEVIE